jgi:hypothetical protein
VCAAAAHHLRLLLPISIHIHIHIHLRLLLLPDLRLCVCGTRDNDNTTHDPTCSSCHPFTNTNRFCPHRTQHWLAATRGGVESLFLLSLSLIIDWSCHWVLSRDEPGSRYPPPTSPFHRTTPPDWIEAGPTCSIPPPAQVAQPSVAGPSWSSYPRRPSPVSQEGAAILLQGRRGRGTGGSL